MLATLCLLLATGCTVEVKPQVLPNVRLPWQKPVPPPAPWWKLGVEHVSIRKPAKPAEAPVIESPKPKPTAAIHHEGSRQYILRSGRKHYWSAQAGAWVATYRSCGAGGCTTQTSVIKPGQ